jgi:hypothetical protein
MALQQCTVVSADRLAGPENTPRLWLKRKAPTSGYGDVRLDGYHRQPPNTLEVLDARGNRIALLVVPAQTEPDRAHSIAMAAAATGDATRVESLLAV